VDILSPYKLHYTELILESPTLIFEDLGDRRMLLGEFMPADAVLLLMVGPAKGHRVPIVVRAAGTSALDMAKVYVLEIADRARHWIRPSGRRGSLREQLDLRPLNG
jgi:hypothetical protein